MCLRVQSSKKLLKKQVKIVYFDVTIVQKSQKYDLDDCFIRLDDSFVRIDKKCVSLHPKNEYPLCR